MSTRSTTTPDPQDGQGLSLVVESESGDSVIIGGEIEIVLLQVEGDRAHIGVMAPEGVTIERGEVYGARVQRGS